MFVNIKNMETKKEKLNEEEIRALIEGAYAQTTTLPGFWLNYDDFRTKLSHLIAECCNQTLDIDKLVTTYYPNAAFLDDYQIIGSNETFKAFRIAPNKLTCIKEIKKKVEQALREISSNDEGWKAFAAIGLKIDKSNFISMGFIGIRQGIECLFGDRYEFKTGDPTKHETPLQIREKKNLTKAKLETKVNCTAKQVSTTKPKQGSFMGTEIENFAYFPKRDTSYGWDYAINELSDKIALEERWYYEEKDKQVKPILKNYLSYTFARLCYEDKLEKELSAEEHRQPRLKILQNQKYAVWNTGLVDSIYDPIYAFFKRNHGKNEAITQPWIFVAFATANSYHQNIITDFPYKPERAQYFDDPRELFYDITAQSPTLDWQHFIKENIARLPQGFVRLGATQGFQFEDDPQKLPKQERNSYYERLSKAIYEDDNWLQFLTTKFRNALDIALSRVAWNYKTAIPVYYPKEHKMQLLLPLALESKDTIDVALVCNHKYNPKEGVNNYEGRTIFTLQMAYNNARLITRPDSDWLMADMCIR